MTATSREAPTQVMARPFRELRAGDVVDGKYAVLEALGTGGMGSVYRVRHRLLAQELAFKVMRPGRVTVRAQRRFFREASLALRIVHPNVATVRDFGCSLHGLVYLVMDLVQGPTLASLLERGPVPEAEAVGLVSQLLAGLAEAHRVGVLHRDIKPANLALEGDRLKILDFGLAKDLCGDPSGSDPGVPVGTPLYMSPEQVSGAPCDGRTDVYAAGIVLYELLCGRPPFMEGSRHNIMHRHLNEAPPAPSETAPHPVSASLDRVVLKALAKEPAERWQTAAAMRAAFAGASAANYAFATRAVRPLRIRPV